MTTDDVCKMLYASKGHVSALVRDKILNPKLDKGSYVFDREEILKALGVTFPVDEPFITQKQAAKLLNVNPHSVTLKAVSGHFPCYTMRKGKKGTRYLFLKSEIEAYIKIESSFDMWLSKYAIMTRIMDFIYSIAWEADLTKSETEVIKYILTGESLTKSRNENVITTHFHNAAEKINKYISNLSISSCAVLTQTVATQNKTIDGLKNKIRLLEEIKGVKVQIESVQNKIDLSSIKKKQMRSRVESVFEKWHVVNYSDLALIELAWAKKHQGIGMSTLATIEELMKSEGITWADGKSVNSL